MKKYILILLAVIATVSGYSQERSLLGLKPGTGQPGWIYKDTLKSISYASPLYPINATTVGVDTTRFTVASFNANAAGDSVILTFLDGRRLAAKAASTTGGVSGSAGAISALTAATSDNSINNGNFSQNWSWNSLTGSATSAPALGLFSSSTAGVANGNSEMLRIEKSGANANANHTSYGLDVIISNTGTGSKNYGASFVVSGATTNRALYAAASGGTDNYAAILAGWVGIGTLTPGVPLDVVGNIRTTATVTAATVTPTGNLDFGNGGGAHASLYYNGGSPSTRTGVSYLGGTYNAGLLFHTYGGLGTATMLFGNGVDASTATVANTNMAIFDNKNVTIGGLASVTNRVFAVGFTSSGTPKTSHPFPSMTEAQRTGMTMTASNDGDHVYQTDGTKGVYRYEDGTGWIRGY